MSLPAPPPELLWTGPEAADWTVAFAHGAGAGMDSEFMTFFAEGLAEWGIRVARFEFPYMAQRRAGGGKRPPDRQPVLIGCWQSVLGLMPRQRLVLAGKSLGGRMASMVFDESDACGLVCLGYPFHPPGKADQKRVEHLRHLKRPVLIVQGERDAFGSPDEVRSYDLPAHVRVHWLPDGDHSFEPRRRSGLSREDNWRAGVRVMAEFIGGLECPAADA